MDEEVLIDKTIWATPPQRLDLEPSIVDVWIADLNVSEERAEKLLELLSPDETDRAQRFRFAMHRIQFIAGRSMLRSILGGYLNIPPKDLAFRYNSYGKPFLADHFDFGATRFNLAHSHGLGLLAVTRGREVGIDLEQMRPEVETLALAERFFAPEEVKVLMQLPPAEQRAAFFECWTRKEAFIKARGMGLSLPLNQFVVAFGAGVAPALLSAKDDPNASARWLVRNLQPADGFAGALVVEAGELEMRCWKFEVGA